MKLLMICFLTCVALASCKTPVWNSPEEGGQAPGIVSEYSVKNYSGGAVIHFDMPDEHTSYIMAVYEISPGVTREAKASKFVDSLVVDGFSKAGTYPVTLYAVGTGEQKSVPVTVEVKPTTPPYVIAFNSLTIQAGFGGALIRGQNPTGDNLVIETMVKNKSSKLWEVYDKQYTNSKNIKFNIRGLASENQDLAVYIRDRWTNYSDTTYTSVVPFQESMIKFSPYVNIKLPTDAGLLSSSYSISRLFDGLMGEPDLLTARDAGMPHHVTIQLQKTYKLSRVKLYQRLGKTNEASRYFNNMNLRKFRIWGSMNPNPNGEMDGTWFLLGEFESIKPSGLPLGQLTAEDIAVAQAGEDYQFDIAPTPEVKFLRLQAVETWAGSTYIHLAEMEIWGILVN